MFISKPAWMSKNLKRAKKSVEKITDQAQLMEISMSEVDKEVGDLAIGKINDQASLIRIAKESKNMNNRFAALEKIKDNNALADIAIKNDGNIISNAVVERLADQKLLCSIAKAVSDDTCAKKAISKINLKELLLTFESVNRFVIQNIAREKLKAIEKFEVEQKAKQYANEMHMKILETTDQKELGQIALDAYEKNNAEVCIAAFEKIKDPSVIAYTALKIAEYAGRSCRGSLDVLINMLKKVKDEKVLAEIIKVSYFKDIINYCARNISDNSLFADAAINAELRETKLLAIDKLDKSTQIAQGALDNIALNEHDVEVRCYALRFLKNMEILSGLINSEDVPSIVKDWSNKRMDILTGKENFDPYNV